MFLHSFLKPCGASPIFDSHLFKAVGRDYTPEKGVKPVNFLNGLDILNDELRQSAKLQLHQINQGFLFGFDCPSLFSSLNSQIGNHLNHPRVNFNNQPVHLIPQRIRFSLVPRGKKSPTPHLRTAPTFWYHLSPEFAIGVQKGLPRIGAIKS